MNNKERLSLIMILTMLLAGCDANDQAPPSLPQPSSQASPQSDAPELATPAQEPPAPKVLQEDKSHIFLERCTDATDGGVARLIDKMAAEGLSFYQTAEIQNGLTAHDDVVLLKINRQWAERGGTNTDLITFAGVWNIKKNEPVVEFFAPQLKCIESAAFDWVESIIWRTRGAI